KILAWSLLGVRMREYDDVVGPHSKRELQRYLEETIPAIEGYVETLVRPKVKRPRRKRGEPTLPPLVKLPPCEEERHGRKVLTKLRRLRGDLGKEFDTVNPWERVHGWGEEDLELIGSVAG